MVKGAMPNPSVAQLEAQLSALGWTLGKISTPNPSTGRYTVKAVGPGGQKVSREGNTPEMALSAMLAFAQRSNGIRTFARLAALFKSAGAWNLPIEHRLEEIGQRYAELPVYDPKAVPAWQALAEESQRQADALRQQLKIKVTDDPEPYPHHAAMIHDIHHNQNFVVSRAHSDHPVWTPDQNVNFRIVHDVMGHGGSGGDFGWNGERLACSHHYPLISPLARQALTTECFAPETLIRTRTGYRPISEIREGDEVLSDDGRFNRVLAVHERDHDGELYELETRTTLGPIRVTGEHVVKTLVSQHPRKQRSDAVHPQYCNPGKCGPGKSDKQDEHHRIDWLEVSSLREKGYLVLNRLDDEQDLDRIDIPVDYWGKRPRPNQPFSFKVTDEFLWVIGIYLAEGSARPGSGLSFGLHKREQDYADRIVRFFESFGYGARVWDKGGNAIEVYVSSAVLSNWFTAWLGRGSHNKSIPAEILNLPIDRLQHVIDGIMDGDGSLSLNVLGQTSPILALQVVEAALRQKAYATVSIVRPEGKKVAYYIEGASATIVKERRRARRGFWEVCGETLTRIESIRKVPYIGKVYDLTVENNPTYTVHNVVVHNCLGQTAYALRKGSHGFGPQKMAMMEDLTNEWEKQNGQQPWVPHGEDWRVPAQPNEVMPVNGVQNGAWGWFLNPQTGQWEQDPNAGDTRESKVFVPERYGTGIPNPTAAPADPETGDPLWSEGADYLQGKDPNANWEVPPEVAQHALPAPAPGSPEDYLDRQGAVENTAKMQVPWWERDKEGNWVYPVDEQKRIILNAFRVAMLSPLKELKHNAAHYQGIYDMPANAKPHEMWERLDNERRRYNAANGHDPMGHLSYWKEVKALGDWVQSQTGLSHAQAMDEAKRRVFKKLMEAEQELDPTGEGDPLRTELEAHKLVGAWIKSLVKHQMFRDWDTYNPDEWSDTPAEQHEQMALTASVSASEYTWNEDGPEGAKESAMAIEHAPPLVRTAEQLALDPSLAPIEKGDRYAGFMGTHLDAISQVAQHIDDIRAAALKDIYTDGGRGFLFRNAIMNMDLKGVNPKVASFIWYMLYPVGSQLGIIDTHIARGFQRPYEEIGTPKDYYKMERMQKTLRDLSGYGDMPLGTFHHGMWDLVRAKDWQQGWEHSDHSPLRIDEPEPWDQHDWTGDLATAKMGTDWVGPPQMEYARPHAENVGQMYEDEFAGLPRGKVPRLVPVQAAASYQPGARVSWDGRTGTVVHLEGGAPGGPRFYLVKSDDAGQILVRSDKLQPALEEAAVMPDTVPPEWHTGPDTPEQMDAMVRNAGAEWE